MDRMEMIEFVHCVPELIIVVNERDAPRSYDTMRRRAGLLGNRTPRLNTESREPTGGKA